MIKEATSIVKQDTYECMREQKSQFMNVQCSFTNHNDEDIDSNQNNKSSDIDNKARYICMHKGTKIIVQCSSSNQNNKSSDINSKARYI